MWRDLAEHYRNFGFNISCMSASLNEYNAIARSITKQPSHPWHDLFHRKQESAELDNYNWSDCIGIGTFTGRDGLLVIDIDGCGDENLLYRILMNLGLPHNYSWVSQTGSKYGYHIYVFCEWPSSIISKDEIIASFPPSKNYLGVFYKIELLARVHCVLPPSLHNAGNKYKWLFTALPENRPRHISLEKLIDTIKSFCDYREKKTGSAYGEKLELIPSNGEFLIEDIIDKEMIKYMDRDIYLFIDLETSGLVTDEFPEIIQIAWILSDRDGNSLKRKSQLIKSNFIFENDRSKYFDISFAVARRIGIDLLPTLKHLLNDIDIADTVISHNSEFDVGILRHYYIELFDKDPFQGKRILCTMNSLVDYCKLPGNYGYKYPTLGELYFKAFSNEMKGAHNAENDVINLYRIFYELNKLGIIQ